MKTFQKYFAKVGFAIVVKIFNYPCFLITIITHWIKNLVPRTSEEKISEIFVC